MGQRNLSRKAGGIGVSRNRDCQQQGGRGPGASARVNSGEVPFKAVMFNKPERTHKLLTGLNQKVRGQEQGLQRSPAADDAPPAQRHDPTRSGVVTEHGKPVARPFGKVSRKVS